MHVNSVNYLKDAAVRVEPSTEFDFSSLLDVQQRQICMDHTLCFILEEEVVIAVVPDEDEDVVGHSGGGGSGNADGFHWQPEQVGEQLWADLESGLVKEKHIVATRHYIVGYEVPVQSVINGQLWHKGESVEEKQQPIYSISGILVDESLDSCGLVEVDLHIEPGEFIIHKH